MSPFGYDQYREELSRFVTDADVWTDDLRYKRVYGGTVAYRPTCSEQDGSTWRDQTFWDPQHLRRTAEAVAAVLDALGATRLLAFPEDNKFRWFSGDSIGRRWSEPKIQFLRRQGADVDFATWQGGLLVEGDALSFIDEFIDYSYTLNRSSMQLVSCELPLLVRIEYYMTACFISAETGILARVE